MAATKIEWADWTWNPWWGCTEISPECGEDGGGPAGSVCYAAVFASRQMHPQFAGVAQAGHWTGVIRPASEAAWAEPFKWKSGLVFTCSQSDFWHEDVPLDALARALDVIYRTPWLTYLILTKRPGMIARRLADVKRDLPRNAWLGATIGHSRSIPLLKPFLRIDAPVHFLSCEPLLTSLRSLPLAGVNWVIGGGQSGNGAALSPVERMQELRDMCVAAGVPFFLKQWGTWASNPTPRPLELDMKAKGGATLDGRLWRQLPKGYEKLLNKAVPETWL